MRYEILEHIAVLSTNRNGYTKELNVISWNGYPPKFDLREWAPDHETMSKGITLTAEELAKLLDVAEERRDNANV